jgi:hypothetical protein
MVNGRTGRDRDITLPGMLVPAKLRDARKSTFFEPRPQPGRTDDLNVRLVIELFQRVPAKVVVVIVGDDERIDRFKIRD